MTRYLIVDAYNVSHVLARVDADTPLGALDAYSIAEGFAPYSDTEMAESVYYGEPAGWIGAPFTNHEIIARPLPAGPGYDVRLGKAGYGVTRGGPDWLWIADACRYEEALEIAAWANRTPYTDEERTERGRP